MTVVRRGAGTGRVGGPFRRGPDRDPALADGAFLGLEIGVRVEAVGHPTRLRLDGVGGHATQTGPGLRTPGEFQVGQDAVLLGQDVGDVDDPVGLQLGHDAGGEGGERVRHQGAQRLGPAQVTDALGGGDPTGQRQVLTDPHPDPPGAQPLLAVLLALPDVERDAGPCQSRRGRRAQLLQPRDQVDQACPGSAPPRARVGGVRGEQLHEVAHRAGRVGAPTDRVDGPVDHARTRTRPQDGAGDVWPRWGRLFGGLTHTHDGSRTYVRLLPRDR